MAGKGGRVYVMWAETDSEAKRLRDAHDDETPGLAGAGAALVPNAAGASQGANMRPGPDV